MYALTKLAAGLDGRHNLGAALAAAVTLWLWPASAWAADVTADSCSVADVQAAADAVAADGGGTVTIPAGECTWDDTVNVEGNVSFVGAGADQTRLVLGAERQFFAHRDVDQFVRYTGLSFFAPDGRDEGTAVAIDIRTVTDFRIDHNYFEGCWHGVISMKRTHRGLIDHNTFVRTDDYSSDYGIHWGQEAVEMPEFCEGLQDAAYQQCEAEWDAWWDDTELHGGNAFEEDWQPGTADAVFVEDNVFDWRGSAIESNWASIQAMVVRHNTIKNRDGNNGGFKPGVVFFEVYGNTFENTAEQCCSALYLRGSGLVYDNTFVNYARGGSLYVYREAFGYHYTDQVVMDELYIWDNAFENGKYTDDAAESWPEDSQGDNELIAENENYFYRTPGPGDRIDPYTPFPYPHPGTGEGVGGSGVGGTGAGLSDPGDDPSGGTGPGAVSSPDDEEAFGDAGCGCRTAAGSRSRASWSWLLALGVAASVSGRRRRTTRPRLVPLAAMGVALVVAASAACSYEVDRAADTADDSEGGAGVGASSTGEGAAASGGQGAGSGVGASDSGGASGDCDTSEHTGDATFYDFADGTGKCMFDPSPHDMLITAINHVDFADATACGACARIFGPDGEVTVRVVDYIGDSSPAGNLDLSPDAFAYIAPLPDGRVLITWHYVPCEVQGPIVYHFKDGSTAEWWTAVQIRNHKHAIATVEYLDEGGVFQPMERTSYNYFVADDGVGSSPITFRVTDIYGHELVDEGVAHVEEGDVAGAAQFPDCVEPAG